MPQYNNKRSNKIYNYISWKFPEILIPKLFYKYEAKMSSEKMVVEVVT